MNLEQQPSNGRRCNVGRSARGRGRTSAGVEKNFTGMTTTAAVTPMQSSSLSSDTKMKVLTAEMELLNDFLFKKHGVRVLNVNSGYFKAHHASTSEMDQIRRSLDASLTDTPQTELTTNDERSGDDLDETLIVVKEEPNWVEEDTLIVDPGEADSDERTDSAEGNVATVSEGSRLNVEKRRDVRSAEPTFSNGGNKEHKCGYCRKTFGNKSNMKRHEMTHTGEKPFKCQFCPRRFTRKHNKKDHERSHGDERPFSCELCDASFRRLETKTAHMRTHTREKAFQCEDCDARFGSKAEKVKHMRIHTGEKPFHCEYCDKRFTQSSHLSRHLRLHTNEKPYSCSIYGNKFADVSNLRRHQKTHRK